MARCCSAPAKRQSGPKAIWVAPFCILQGPAHRTAVVLPSSCWSGYGKYLCLLIRQVQGHATVPTPQAHPRPQARSVPPGVAPAVLQARHANNSGWRTGHVLQAPQRHRVKASLRPQTAINQLILLSNMLTELQSLHLAGLWCSLTLKSIAPSRCQVLHNQTGASLV